MRDNIKLALGGALNFLGLKKVIRSISVFLGILLFYLFFFVHVEPTEIGIMWNPFSGNMDTVESGIHLYAPWKMVSVIDLRPMKVGITTTANTFNYMLVQFDKKGWKEFVHTQGFGYYWWNNRFSFNFGYKEEYKGFKDLMRGYAYGGHYSFIKVIGSSGTNP